MEELSVSLMHDVLFHEVQFADRSFVRILRCERGYELVAQRATYDTGQPLGCISIVLRQVLISRQRISVFEIRQNSV